MTYYLIDAGSETFAVMAVLRSTLRLSLGEARSIITNTPSALPEMTDELAAEAVGRLRAAGATVSTTLAEAPSEPDPEPEPEVKPAHTQAELEDALSRAWTVVSAPAADVPSRPDESPAPAGSQYATNPGGSQYVTNPGGSQYATNPGGSQYATNPGGGEEMYEVPLPDAGNTKLVLVKCIKEATGWGLKESKDWADMPVGTPMQFPRTYAQELAAYLTSGGFPTTARPIGSAAAPKPASAATPGAINRINITNPGPHRMQIIPLLKKELKMKYADAADIAEDGGELDSFPSAEAARRVADSLRELGAEFTIG